MKETARVVVIGGGNLGASVLYHLAKEGWNDCILVEKAELTSGATWHAAGLVTRMVGDGALGRIHDYGVDFYKSIEKETDQGVSWHNCGSIRVASTPDHVDWLQHMRDGILARGQEAHLISPTEVKRLNPLYDVSRIVGALYTPDDGHVDPSGACNAMAKGARALGAEISRRNRVVDVRRLKSGDWEVVTEQGTISCEHVVNAGGYHAARIGEFSGIEIPITLMQHHYIITDAVPELMKMGHEIPVTRDDYYTGYIRREQASILIGLYDTDAPKAKWIDGCPWESENELFDPDWDAITPWLERCFEQYPALRELGIRRVVNGAIPYTPDGSMLIGPAPGLKNYWLCCGAAVGIACGPGVGKYLAQWIVHGATEISMRAFDPRRFGVWVDKSYALSRATEEYATRLRLPFPQDQRSMGRNIRKSGAYLQTANLGAIFEEINGWERARLFAPKSWNGKQPKGWHRNSAFEVINAEAIAAHEGVVLGDFSAFAKFEIKGAHAEQFLNRLCANDIPKAIGGITLTLLLNDKGMIEGEATIARLGSEHFWFIAGTAAERRLWDWLHEHKAAHEEVYISNKSDAYGILTLAGPKARHVLKRCTDIDLKNRSFPWFRAREITVDGIQVIALRLSYTGELAWELHAPCEQLGELWDSIWAAGQAFGIRPIGSAALNSLRLEKAYRGGAELAPDVSPIEAGQMRFVRLEKPFLGREALLKRKDVGEVGSIVYLEIEAGDADCLGGEAVFHDKKPVGAVTSGGFGAISRKSLAFAFVPSSLAEVGTMVQVSILGSLRPAKVISSPALDPLNLRIRSDEEE